MPFATLRRMRKRFIRIVCWAVVCAVLGGFLQGFAMADESGQPTVKAPVKPRPRLQIFSPEEAAERGIRDAKRDLAKNKIELRGSGLAPRYRDRMNPESMYKDLLHERTGLRFVNTGCVILPGSEAYNKAYSREVKTWMTNTFGADVFSRARSDSRKAYEAYRSEKQQQAKAQKEKPLADDEYVVQAGDTCFAISKRHGCSLDALLAANKGLDPRRLQVNQRIHLPKPTSN